MRASRVQKTSIIGFASCALVTALLLDCSSPGTVGSSTNGAGGGSQVVVLDQADARTNSDPGTSTPGASPTGDTNCGAAISDMTQEPADLLLVLDRSTSMSWDMTRDDKECPTSSTTCQQRWSTVIQTLDHVLANSSAKIRWGLKLFATPISGGNTDPNTENCTVGPGVEVEVGAGNAAKINDSIQGAVPMGYTPTLAALTLATQYLTGLADTYPRYILLATDGEPNCDGTSETASGAVQVNHVVSQIKSAVEADLKIYVVGMGPATSIRNLDKFAVAGGTDHYYPATSASELGAALLSIVGQVASCTYTLSDLPPDPNNVAVYLDKQIVPRDSAQGWILAQDQRSVLFTGIYCEGIKAEKYKQVQVYFGCPDTAPPTVIP
jgi:hypothetical protein